MKVLLIGPSKKGVFSRSFGGVSKVCDELYNSLCERGVDINRVITGPNTSFGRYKKISIFRAVLNVLVNPNKEIRNLPNLLKLSLIDFSEYDIVHVHGLQGGVFRYVAGRKIPRLRKFLTIHSFHMYKTEEEIKLDMPHMSCFDVISFVSLTDAKKSNNFNIGYNGLRKVVYNGTEEFIITKEVELKWDLCFIGSLEKRKGIDRFLSEELIEKKILFIGPDKSTGYYPKILSNYNNYLYAGVMDVHHCLSALSTSKLLVVPSYSESFGLVYVEALMRGIPIIGYRPILEEFLELYGSIGRKFIYPIDVKEDLSQLVELVLAQEGQIVLSERQEISDMTKTLFSWKKVSENYLDIYNNLLN